jgi:gliding motility-associated-like protein
MKTRIFKWSLLCLLTLGGLQKSSAQLSLVNTGPTTTPTALVNAILGGGVQASNITYTGSALSRGRFTSNATNIGMPDGIVLSTGEPNMPAAPASLFKSSAGNNNSDPQLAALVSPQTVRDAAVLEFDFSVASDTVKFEYVFGSEEYNDYVNTSFNDVFGFFINGPGLPANKNLAIVPGTTNTAVSINNINNGGPYAGLSSGPCTNCAYFVDNVNGSQVFLDAFTTVLQAKTAVQPCELYHIKLAIGDVSDQAFDSDVFIKGSSFASVGLISSFANGVPININDTIYGCPGGTVTLNLNPASNYFWSTGESTQSIVVNVPPVGAPAQSYSAYVTNPPLYTCFAFTNTSWIVAAPPSATISGNNSFCTGSNTTLTANAGTTYLWSTGATTQSIIVSTAGNYTVTVSNGPGCSATSTPFSVTAGSAVANITGPTAICSGAAANLNANSGISYVWSNGQTTQNTVVNTTGTYTVTVTQNGGCTASASQTLTVASNPIPTITGANTICAGGVTSFNAGAGYSSYLWSSGQTTQNITPLSAGSYTVTVSNASGCTGTVSQSFTINSLPIPSITGVTSVCQGAAATLNVAAGFSSYVWSNGATSTTINPTIAANYTVTVTNSNGCTASVSQNVTVNNNPTPTITGLLAICNGANTTLDGGVGYSTYLWSNGSTLQNNTTSIAGTYTVTVSNASGCTGTVSATLVVNANPLPSVTGITAICAGSNTTFSAGAGFTNYLWSNGVTTQNNTINTANTYTVTVTNANGCTGTGSNTLVVNALPMPTITGTSAVCQGVAATLNATAGLSTYAWSNGATSATINPTVAGNYTVTVTDANGCTGSVAQNVVVNANPSPVITGILAICNGANTNLNGGIGFTNYLWSNGATSQNNLLNTAGSYTVTVTDINGCTGSSSATLVVNANPTPVVTGVNMICAGTNATFDAGGGYSNYLWSNGVTTQNNVVNATNTYTVTVTNANGCTGSANNSLTVNALPTPNITGVTAVCQGFSATLNANAGYSNYIWSNGATTTTINPTTGNTYTVTVTDGNGCTSSTDQIVTINGLPIPSITGVAAVCQGANANLNAGTGFASYLWSNGSVTQIINPNVAATYTVTVTDGNGCTGSTNINVVVSNNPTPSITGVNVICQNDPTTFDAGGGYSQYQWSNGGTSQNISPNTTGAYTVTVTDGNGCTGTTSYSLTVNALPTPNITGVTAVCQGFSATLNANAGYINYIWSNGATTTTINPTTGNTYTVTVTDGNGCTSSTDQIVTINGLPIPSITGVAAVCQGANANLNAGTGFASYLWSNGSVTQIISPNVAATYTVTVTDGNGCTGSTNINVVVNQNPTPSITGVNVICQNDPTSFDAGGGYSQYQWSNGGTSQNISPNTTGAYTVTVTDGNGCTGTTSYSLTVNALPTPNITGITAVCQGFSATLTANAGYSNYIWSNGATTTTINPTTGNTYTVTVTDGNGCTSSVDQVVIINALPTPAITGQATVCQGNNANIDAGNGYVLYQWSNGSNAQVINPNVAATYTVTVTDGNGCTGSTNINVVVNQNPTPSITGVNVICQNNPTTFDAGGGYSQYQWSNGGTSQNISPNTTGAYTVTVTDGNGCTGTTSYSLTVNALPTPNITGITAVCQGFSATLTANAGYSNYIWSNGATTTTINPTTGNTYTVTVTDGNGCTSSVDQVVIINALPTPAITGITSICDGTTSSFDAGNGFVGYQWSASTTTQILTTGTAGNYTVTVTDINGCTASTSISLIVNQNPTPKIAGNDTICAGFVSLIDAGNGFVNYVWSNGSNAQIINVNTAGNYTVTVTDGNGCTGEDVFKLDVLTAEASITPSGPTSFCDGGQVTLQASIGLSYLWSTGATTREIVITTSGNYTVQIVNLNGCTAVSSLQNVSVHPYPIVRFVNDTSTLCGALRVKFKNISTYDAGSIFAWDFGDGFTSSIASPTHDYKTVGTYIIRLVIESPYGCVSEDRDTITVDFAPEAIPMFTMSTNLVPLFEANVDFVDQSLNAYTWLWGFGDGDTSTEKNPSHVFDKPGTYLVKLNVTNLAGCRKVYELPVTVAPFWIPNAFSPNGDNRNDLFFDSNYTLDVISFDMVIRNRWGQVVYETKDFGQPWDGRGNDESIAPEGTYVYDINIRAKTGLDYNFKGTVNLIR